ncbi:hypothetical protein GCM10012287_21650 [Streptomyces daqingensis]|uniref:Uncharacterized protein n=1 Tax=Streptomyces daqingensis TaxID=1472640 RepID=A0ABQ2M7V5_9ACTN|nr:hypothetical protein GCM10012287_21650 [Streptomyces daqingensis]
MVPEFGDDGFLPPGRYRVDPVTARELLVEAETFRQSQRRVQLWDGFEGYLSRFFDLEGRHRDAVGEINLIHAVWLGGSFVSAKLDPHNIDLTVLLDDQAARSFRGLPGAKWLTSAFNRKACLADFGVSPLVVRYRPIVSIFQSEALTPEDQAYLRERGAWDDWWQRCREGDTAEPTVDSAKPRRGYLEVTL